jgi:hypothetical protein
MILGCIVPVQTCRHFRYQVPREVADELRDADPGPCEICDSMPHRKLMANGSSQHYGARVPVAFYQTRGNSVRSASGLNVVRVWLARLQAILDFHRPVRNE